MTGGHEAIIDPVLFDHVQEIVKASIEDERGFSGVNPWSTKLVCGKCGNYFRIKPIRFFPDYHIDAELVDGSRMEMELKPCWPEERKVRRRG